MSEIKEQIINKNSSELNKFTENVLRTKDHPTLKYIAKILGQHSFDRHEAIDIFLEAYYRSVHSEDKINTPEAWLKRTCLNIIRERKRKQQRNQSFDDYSSSGQKLYLDENEAFVQGLPVSAHLPKLVAALNDLPEKSKKVLFLRLIDELSWKDVAEIRSAEESKPVTEGAVRKQGNRSLQELRKRLKPD